MFFSTVLGAESEAFQMKGFYSPKPPPPIFKGCLEVKPSRFKMAAALWNLGNEQVKM